MENKKINNSEDVFNEVKKDFSNFQEKVTLVGVNAKNEILYKKVIFMGGVNTSIIDKRIIFQELLLNNCSRFFLAHNHPSGDITPSQSDFNSTKELKKASEIMEIQFLDHIVYSKDKFYSMFDNEDM